MLRNFTYLYDLDSAANAINGHVLFKHDWVQHLYLRMEPYIIELYP